MKLRETKSIGSDANTVWDYVSRPERWQLFVEKIESVEAQAEGFYRIRIGGKRVLGKIDIAEPPRRIRFVGAMEDQPGQSGFAIEYLLATKPSGVSVTEIQELRVPFPFSLLIAFIHRFGKSKGPSNLDTLKRLCESK